LNCTDGGFTPRARTFDDHVNFLDANRAAKGVLFREPLKPADPALPQQTVFPCWSVTVTMVLLKEANTCTCAEDIWRLTLRELVARRVLCAFLAIVPH
jgi:hypothetical protein